MLVGENCVLPLIIVLKISYLSACKLDDIVYIVGLNFCFVRGFVAVNFAAFGAFVKYYITLFRVGERLYRVHDPAAFARSVSGIDVHVQGAEAFGAMVAGGVAKRKHLKAAVCTNKAVIVFCEKFLFHNNIFRC